MYILKKIAKRRLKHHDSHALAFEEKDKEYIEQGEIYFQIHNGTIGRGARYKNIKYSEFLKLLNDKVG